MIDLMIKNIFENSNKIDGVIKHVNSKSKVIGLGFIFIGVGGLSIFSILKDHEEKINKLETALEEMKSKGE